ncbi:MAG: hypothetical protein WC832_02870 [Anaerolineales bacterium]
MSKRTMGLMLIALGAVGLVVSLAADVIGIGSYPGINGAQLLGAATGLILALGGVWLAQNRAGKKK